MDLLTDLFRYLRSLVGWGCLFPIAFLTFLILTDRWHKLTVVPIRRQFGAEFVVSLGRYVRGSLPESTLRSKLLGAVTPVELILIDGEFMEIVRIPWESLQEVRSELTSLTLAWNDDLRGPAQAVFTPAGIQIPRRTARTLNYQRELRAKQKNLSKEKE